MAFAQLLSGVEDQVKQLYAMQQQAASPEPEAPHRTVDGDAFMEAAQQSAAGYNKPATPSRTKSGNPQQDWMSLIAGLPANEQSIASAFPQFAEWYPGSTYQKADIKGPWGWADVIGNLASGQGKWQWYTGSSKPKVGTSMLSGYSPQFTDPLTKQYEQLLQGQLGLYQQQQRQMQQEAAQKQAVRAQTDAAVKRLLDFVNQRVGKLQQPAYTGSEQEILRTQFLDPLERDRGASKQRALENIGSRGFDPSSGIAQELLQMVDRGFDTARTEGQRDLAEKQIHEQRSRDQEAQQLLQMAAQMPEAAARGDLSFVEFLNQLINKPGQEAMATGALLSDLPVQRTQLGAQILGLGGQPQSSVPNVLALLNNAQANRFANQAQSSDYWRNLGFSFLR